MSDRRTPRNPARTALVAIVLLAALVAPVATAAAQEPGEIRIAQSGFGDADAFAERGETQFIWADESTTLEVALETSGSDGEGHYEVCVRSEPADDRSPTDLECRSEVLTGNSTEELAFTFDGWPEGYRGEQTVSIVVTADTLSRDEAARATHAVSVVGKAADADGDGASNRREVDGGTDFTDPDTDDDGLADGLELDTYNTDPTGADTDGDGLSDGAEVTTHETDPTRADTDGDGLDDRTEVTEYGTNPNRADTDGDGLSDALEVNTHETDPARADTDGDGLNDAAEVREHETNPTDTDTDEDGLSDALEVHTYGTDPAKTDSDEDGISDGAEVNELATDPSLADTDDDGLSDGAEVNTYGTNPNRADTDGDGLADGAEVNRYDTDPMRADTDGDGQADASEVDVTQRLTPFALLLGIPFVGAAAGSALWATRRRWLPHVPHRVRTEVVGSGATDRVTGTVLSVRDWADRVRSWVAEVVGGGTSERATDEATAANGGRDRPDPGPDEGPSEVPLEMLSNEDAVLAVLRRNGGRVRQSDLVEETGWSKSKVSRVLSRMDDAGRVTKINVGRGNVITLPGEEPDGADSPFSK
ncbi:MarR family transcriptional regulator [Halorarum halophilum]|uniref:MarR family transcriptional regulator n=1 Tax=Halorarum halophilum TaxID=2743090 RepID=A0A7D5GYW9_9EURY|nr:binary toxin-like calcium binding domain-containing protein [Halobaculum halophilum]QLG29049.1 MarR family transcriptional regulator [Halobaculum halophilum]